MKVGERRACQVQPAAHVLFLDPDDAMGVWQRQWFQQHAVDE